jgi:hypothetical protein
MLAGGGGGGGVSGGGCGSGIGARSSKTLIFKISRDFVSFFLPQKS